MSTIEIKPLRIADAAILRKLGVFPGSLKRVEASIRHLQAVSEQDCLLLTRTGPDGEPEYGFIALVPDPFHPEHGRLSLKASSPDLMPLMLEMAARSAFVERSFLRIDTWVPLTESVSVFEKLGFQPESTLSGDLFRTAPAVDRKQLGLLKTRNAFPAVGVIPYRYGLITVTGTADRVESLAFHASGETVTDPYIRDHFHIWRLLDESSQLTLSPDSLERAQSEPRPPMVAQAVQEVKAYLARDRVDFDLTIDLSCGSPFQQKVWDLLRQIPFGTTVTYLDIARQLAGDDIRKARSLTRAVGSACGANPVPIIIPCHRVIGHDGRLTGYSGGIQNKEFLLAHELFGMR